MAIWQGSAINTNETAKVFNQLAEKKSLPMIVKLNSLYYHMAGKGDGTNPSGNLGMKSSKMTGKNIEVPLMGKLAAPASIADGSAEYATATPNYDSAIFGAAEFPLAHYGLVQAIPDSEFMRFKGQEAKTLDYMQDIYDYVMYGYEDVFGTALQSSTTTNVPARSQLGSIWAAVDDSNTYGTLDRTDAGNADFRGIVASTFGDTTLAKLQLQINTARKNLGKINLGVTGLTLFNKIQQLVQPYSEATYSADTARFGSDKVNFAGVDFILDQRTPSGYIGLLDTRWWMTVMSDDPFTSTGIIRDFTKVSTHILHTTIWIQSILKKPNSCVKITGAS